MLSEPEIPWLQKEIFKTAVSHGWYETPRTFGDRIALMHSELSEALEEFRNGHAVEEIYFNHENDCEEIAAFKSCTCDRGKKPEGVPIELADVIIRILDFAEDCTINMESAIRLKMAYNETRPYRHGGKAL